MNDLDASSDGINVEDIMQKIRESQKDLKSRVLDQEPTENIKNCEFILDELRSKMDINNRDYKIESHHHIIGAFLVKGRQLVHGEVSRYLNPIIMKQNELNNGVIEVMDLICSRLNKVEELSSHLEELSSRMQNLSDELQVKMDHRIDQTLQMMNNDLENKAWLASLLEAREAKATLSDSKKDLGLNYFLFEERFRGTREDIKKRQLTFMEPFEKCRNVLDIGCGRGEFLEILTEHGIKGKGIDLDQDMIDYCLSRELDVEKADAIKYLESLDDKSLDGIFLDQVVEHMEPEYLISMLRLCHQKLNYGYNIVIETVNPLSLVSFMNFYVDMTHQKPLHPETINFLLKATGFRDVQVHFLAPLPDEARLKLADIDPGFDQNLQNTLEAYNQNMEKINRILFGFQDYAVVAKK
jgi:2-polyprenyl-3-methyl-5-hydroxy-6-metoxy-1,4-benzoquinol methylase